MINNYLQCLENLQIYYAQVEKEEKLQQKLREIEYQKIIKRRERYQRLLDEYLLEPHAQTSQ